MRPNTNECAYDAFNRELHVGDEVAVSCNTKNGVTFYHCQVVKWNEEKIHVKVLQVAPNTDIRSENEKWWLGEVWVNKKWWAYY